MPNELDLSPRVLLASSRGLLKVHLMPHIVTHLYNFQAKSWMETFISLTLNYRLDYARNVKDL